ncbi:YkvA family protein [Pontibacter roseus]|uniref:YkvA family protein n=1 Tax=Pontibacter roseus TaxID=336989 RepID=UPI00037C6C71|nr:YkvA family protein [Pontibacter roseus]
MMQLTTLRQKAHEINAEIYAMYLSARHPQVRWYVPLLLAFVVGYAISPIDLVPDLVPVFGFLDDVVLVTLGFSLAYQQLSKDILGKARLRAYEVLSQEGERGNMAYRVVGYVWALALSVAAILFYKIVFLNIV